MAKAKATTRRTTTKRQPKPDAIGTDGLTDKQRVFIEQYFMCGFNATEAARRAGYKDPEQAGYENKRKQEIAQLISERLSTLVMSADEVLARLSELASADMSDFLSKRGRGMTLDLTKAQRAGKLHLVKKYNKTKQGVSIELHDAQAALVNIGRHHKMFTDKIDGSLNGTITNVTSDEMAKARDAAQKWEQERFGDA